MSAPGSVAVTGRVGFVHVEGVQQLIRRLGVRTQLTARISPPTRRDHVAWFAPVRALAAAVASVIDMVRSRRRRPWLAMVVVPLAMIATMSLFLWWAWPALVFCMWWWADSVRRWSWLVGLEVALFGVQWVLVGAYALGAFPQDRVVLVSLWTALPVALVAVSVLDRRRAHVDH